MAIYYSILLKAILGIKYAHCLSMTGGETPPLRGRDLTENQKNGNLLLNIVKNDVSLILNTYIYRDIFIFKFTLKMLHWCNIWCTKEIGREPSNRKGSEVFFLSLRFGKK